MDLMRFPNEGLNSEIVTDAFSFSGNQRQIIPLKEETKPMVKCLSADCEFEEDKESKFGLTYCMGEYVEIEHLKDMEEPKCEEPLSSCDVMLKIGPADLECEFNNNPSVEETPVIGNLEPINGPQIHSEQSEFSESSATFPQNKDDATVKKAYTCTLCDYETTYPSYFERHMKRHSLEKENSPSRHFNSDERTLDGEGSSDAQMLRVKHRKAKKCKPLSDLNNQTEEKSFACSQCEFKTDKPHKLKRHELIHSDKKPFSCELCDYKTKYKYHIKDHMRTHTDERPYRCKFCDYRARLSNNLKIHEMIHTGEQPFACTLCEYKTRHPKSLKVHIMRMHTGEKPFACTLCNYRTFTAGRLKEHSLTHSKPPKAVNSHKETYKCSLCSSRVFNRKSDLTRHMQTHTGKKCFKCTVCSYGTNRKTDLIRHEQTHTKEPKLPKKPPPSLELSSLLRTFVYN